MSKLVRPGAARTNGKKPQTPLGSVQKPPASLVIIKQSCPTGESLTSKHAKCVSWNTKKMELTQYDNIDRFRRSNLRIFHMLELYHVLAILLASGLVWGW